jgi:predicted nucleic acid-binding protein
MMIETDILYAFIKEEDWLKPTADKLMWMINEDRFGTVYTSREGIHELYYVCMSEGVPLEEFISRIAALMAIDNLVFLETTPEIDLLALTIMKQYKITSIFDAYYASTALNQVSDHILISTDEIYDRIPGLKRYDPRKLVEG